MMEGETNMTIGIQNVDDHEVQATKVLEDDRTTHIANMEVAEIGHPTAVIEATTM
jgi:hypothetical protein